MEHSICLEIQIVILFIGRWKTIIWPLSIECGDYFAWLRSAAFQLVVDWNIASQGRTQTACHATAKVLLYTLPLYWLSRMIWRIYWNGKKLDGYPYNHQQCHHHYQEHNHHSHRHTSIHRSISQSTMLIIMWMHITGMIFFFSFVVYYHCALFNQYCSSFCI